MIKEKRINELIEKEIKDHRKGIVSCETNEYPDYYSLLKTCESLYRIARAAQELYGAPSVSRERLEKELGKELKNLPEAVE